MGYVCMGAWERGREGGEQKILWSVICKVQPDSEPEPDPGLSVIDNR